MATSSIISVHTKDDEYLTVHCHYDGYPEHNGRILFNCIKNYKDAMNLVSNGELSYIDAQKNKNRYHYSDMTICKYDEDSNIIHHHTYFDVINYFMNGSYEFIDYLYIWDKTEGWIFISSEDVLKRYHLSEYLYNEIA